MLYLTLRELLVDVMKKNKLYDEKLKFYEKSHVYKVNDTPLISVTTFISSLFPPFNAKDIARFLAGLPHNKKAKRGVKYFLKEWKKRSEHGTIVHNAIESFINGEEPFIEKEDTESKNKYLQGLKYLESLSEGYERHPEVKIYSESLGLAGTIDLLMIKGNSVRLVDWKTNKKITEKSYKDTDKGVKEATKHLDNCKINTYGLQLMIYGYMLQKEYGYKVEDLELVWLTEKKFVTYNISYDEELVINVLKELKGEKNVD